MTHLLIPRLGKPEFRKGESLGRFEIPLDDLAGGLRNLQPETIYAGLRVYQGRDALVFMYADETTHDDMRAMIKGFYAVDKHNLRSLAAESNLSLSHKSVLIFFERTRLRSVTD